MTTTCARYLSVMAAKTDVNKLFRKAVVGRILQNAATKHKGDFGRIGILGGSKEYTGAPYFAAAAAYRSGADLVHMFCAPEAAPVIKQYMPDLIVHGVLNESGDSATEAASLREIEQWLPRLHTLLIGPGLGRSEAALRVARKTMEAFAYAANQNERVKRNIVIDADGLFLANQIIEVIQKIGALPNVRLWLTPNAAEYSRLMDASSRQLNLNQSSPHDSDSEEERCVALAKVLNVVLVRKGRFDLIATGLNSHGNAESANALVKCETPGSVRRCGGQGDLLSGCIATMATWLALAEGENRRESNEASEFAFEELCSAAAHTACTIVRLSNQLAYNELNFAMLTSDMLRHFAGAVSQTLFT